MILEFDIGNSNIKWRFCSDGKIHSSGSCSHNGRIVYRYLLASIDVVPSCISVVSVLATEKEQFSEWCYRRWGLKPQFAEVARHCAGVTNGYDEVSQMGPDRWLGMIAAYNQVHHDCLVVDSGSACTVDLLLASGQHLGGYIVPGLELMRGALFRDTDRVKLSSINYDDDVVLGCSTNQAVSSGLQLMLLGLVSIALDELIKAGADRPVVIITGGGAQNLAELLEDYLMERARMSDIDSIMLKPDLVFEGLPFIFR